MNEIFIKLLNMSISAGWLSLFVIALRLILKKSPRWMVCVLWAMVAIRLLCPFSIESALSLIPSAETVPEEIIYSESPEIHTGFESFNSAVNPVISEVLAPAPQSRVNPMEIIANAATVVWIAGAAGMAVYALVSYVRIRKRVSEAVRDGDVYVCDRVDSPFILGLFKPRIIIPSDMDAGDRQYVTAHERAHISRGDHIWKPLGYLLLTIYWFNPLMWVSYILLCRDIEAACDEKVIKKLGEEAKKPYASALINCSAQKRMISACPLAFGETGVKGRVKSVLSYKRPGFWIIAVAVVACIVAGVFFLTDPGRSDSPKQESTSELSGLSLEIKHIETSGPDPYITVEWKNETGQDIVYGEEFYIFFSADGRWENARIEENYIWNTLGHYLSSGQRAEKKYHLNGFIMTEPGKYRFETECFIEGASETEYKAIVEFELEKGIEPIGVHTLDPAELVFDAPMYSYVQTVDAAPEYMLVNGTELLESREVITHMGHLEERDIKAAGFEDLFYKEYSDDVGWSKGYSAKKLMEENRLFWELDGNGERYYVLLFQKDGTYFLGEGTVIDGVRRVRWLYRMTEIGKDSGNFVTQLAENGSVYFYAESFEEGVTPEISKFYRMSESEAAEFSSLFAGEKWVYDALVDRLSFEFDGKLLFEGKWLYFGYGQSVFYYDEYFCEGADEAAELIKGLSKKADPYAPIGKTKEQSSDGTVASKIPQIHSIEHDLTGDGYPESCTMTFGPALGINSVSLNIVDVKTGREYSERVGIDCNAVSFWLDGNEALLCISGERCLSLSAVQGEYEICIFDVAIEGERIKITERKATENGGFIRVFDVDDSIKFDPVTDDEKKQVTERMYKQFGNTVSDTGYKKSFAVAGTVDIGEEQFFLVNLQWIAESEEGMPHHESTVCSYVISRDLSKLYEAYFEDDAVLKIYNRQNLIND